MSFLSFVQSIVRIMVSVAVAGMFFLVAAERGAITPQAVQKTLRPAAEMIGIDAFTPCRRPITYRVGSFDERFGVSRDEFVAAMRQAAGLWSDEIGNPLFEYRDDGELPINLVFDERQADTIKLKSVLDSIQSDEGKYEAAKTQYESLVTELQQKKTAYDTDAKKYDAGRKQLETMAEKYAKDSAKYEAEVEQWNTQGGAPTAEYARLERERRRLDDKQEAIQKTQKSLQKEFAGLESDRKAINTLVERVNALVSIVNGLAAKVNSQAENYNDNNRTEEEFEAGLYREEGADRAIDIYQFFDNRELVMVLAHEFGHALGFGHVDDPNALMYYQLNEQKMELSARDKQLVTDLCRAE